MNEMQVEIAAPRKPRAERPPIETVGRQFLTLTNVYYRMFVALMAAAVVNDKTTEATISTGKVPAIDLGYLLYVDEVAKRAEARYLRESVMMKPGKNNQIDLNYYLEMTIPVAGGFADRVIANSAIPWGKPVPFMQCVSQYNSWGSLSPESDKMIGTLGEDQITNRYRDLVQATFALEELERDDNQVRGFAKLTLRVSGDVYAKYCESDDFSPYLAYLMLNNFMMANAQTYKVYDPRKVSATMKTIQTTFGKAPARVNENGFAIQPSGDPLWMPRELDRTAELIAAGDAAMNEDGEFDSEKLAEKWADQLVYVDWLNDVVAYTTSTAKLEVKSLNGVMALDKVTEKVLLDADVKDIDTMRFLQVIPASLGDADPSEAMKYLPKDFEDKEEIKTWTIHKLQTYLIGSNGSGTRGTGSEIRLKHLAGLDLDKEPMVRHKDWQRVCLMYNAYAKLLWNTAKTNPAVVEVPSSMAHLGIMYRLGGLQYYMYALANYTQTHMDKINKEHQEEKFRQAIDPTQRSFKMPNVVLSNDFTGFLPHQARIGSSIQKTPKFAMLPVQTGGGKSILSIAAAVYAIENAQKEKRGKTFRALISTKGRLVQNTITEINRISKGKLNAIPLRPWTLRRMRRQYNIKTFADLIKWFRALPPNTVFVNSYSDFASGSKLYPDLPSLEGFVTEELLDSQFLRIMKFLAFDMVIGDESHLIKNPKSARTKGAYSVFAGAEYRYIMSGTMVSNTVSDLIGQSVAVSPVIFGNNADKAAEKYGIASGIINDDETAEKIRFRMSEVAAYHQATKDEWAYMLPVKKDEVQFATLTPLQEEFYLKLLREAAEKFLEEKNAKGKKAEGTGDDEEGDDEEEEEIDEDMDEADQEEEKFLAQVRRTLPAAEMFLAAPDANEQYLQWDRKPTGLDLISPKVHLADKLIDAHFAKHPRDTWGKNKVIVFGVNPSAIEHMARHSKYASEALIYFAGNDEVVRQFSDVNSGKRIMFAAETALREGENLQMTSLIVRLQSVWAPGDHEQAAARMYRPDPRGRFNRESVDHIWTLTRQRSGDPTLDGVKMARLISKFVSNARVTYQDRRDWKDYSRTIDDLGLFRLNYELLFNAKREDVDNYFNTWDSFVAFEGRLNKQERLKKATELEQRFNEKLTNDDATEIYDINRFVQLAMAEVEPTELAGSKRVFVPWVPNAVPADPEGYGYVILGNDKAEVGQAVLTQFGPGRIKSFGDKSLKVELYGGRVQGFKKSTVAVPTKKVAEFAKILDNPSKWASMSFAVFGGTLPPAPAGKGDVPPIAPLPKPPTKKPVVVEEDDDEVDTMEELDLAVSIINGFPALVVTDPDVEGLDQVEGWERIDPFVSVSFKTWKDAEAFIDEISTKTMLSTKNREALMEEMEELESGRALKLTRQFDNATMRNFFMDQRKKLGKSKNGKPIIKPYWVAFETEIRLAFDTDSHEPSVIRWVKNAESKFAGVKKVRPNPGMWINIFKTVGEARKDLANLAEYFEFDKAEIAEELRQLADEIRELAKPRRRPIR